MEINLYQVLFQAVNFGVVLFVLVKFLYKPVLKLLDDRAHKINSGLAAAEKNLKAQADIEKTAKSEVAKARREASKLVAEAKKDAKTQADSILKDAKTKASKEAERILESARTSAEASKKEMASSLKDLTVATTRKLLSDTLTDKEVQKITSAMVKKLK